MDRGNFGPGGNFGRLRKLRQKGYEMPANARYRHFLGLKLEIRSEISFLIIFSEISFFLSNLSGQNGGWKKSCEIVPYRVLSWWGLKIVIKS